MEKIVFHIDVNSAFLSWEAVYRLAHKGGTQDLRKIASAVGGDMVLRHGIILAKSIPAKTYGIKTGESIPEAKRKCPDLVLVPPNYGLYERCSAAFMEILREYSDVVEQYSIDEAFLDVSTGCHLFGTPEEVAVQIKNRIREELGFTVKIGISANKLLAKMASDFQKPDRMHTLYPEEIKEKMWPLPVSDLFFVGRATAEKLFSMGIRTIGELAGADPAWLKRILKKQGETIWVFANGIDVSPVLVKPPANKGYGNSTTTPYDVTDVKTAARSLFRELWNGNPIRHLGVHTGRVSGAGSGRQRNLFGAVDYEKLSRMDETVDGIRRRFGTDAVMRAAFLGQPIDHMSGGISREKRSVDYDRVMIQ